VATLSETPYWSYNEGVRALRVKIRGYSVLVASVTKRMNLDECSEFYFVTTRSGLKCNVRFDDEEEAMKYAETIAALQGDALI
jgi:hypothetical protein